MKTSEYCSKNGSIFKVSDSFYFHCYNVATIDIHIVPCIVLGTYTVYATKMQTCSLKNSIKGGDRLECKFYDQLEKILVTERSSSTPEVTYDVQEVVVGDKPPQNRQTSEAHEDKDLKFLGHSGLEGKALTVV